MIHHKKISTFTAAFLCMKYHLHSWKIENMNFVLFKAKLAVIFGTLKNQILKL